MDNPDVLSIILSKVDDTVLLNLSKTPMWYEVKKILDNPHFWYLRSQILVGKSLTELNADWRKIYGQVEGIIKNRDPGEIDNLNSVLVITEVFGSSIWKSDYFSTWSRVSSVGGLKYLLENKYIEQSYANVLEAIAFAGRVGSRELVDFLLSLYPDKKIELIKYAREGAVEGDKLELFLYLQELTGKVLLMPDVVIQLALVCVTGGPKIAEYLLTSFKISEIEILRGIKLAIGNNNLKVLELFFELFPDMTDKRSYDAELLHAAEMGRVELIKVLVENAQTYSHPRTHHRDILNIGIRRAYPELVKYALTIVSPATKGNQALAIALKEGREGIVRILLADPRIDPNSNLKNVLLSSGEYQKSVQMKIEHAITYSIKDVVAMWEYGGLASALLILNDRRIDPEQWDKPTFRTAVWALGDDLVLPTVRGFSRGNTLVRGKPMRDADVLTLIEEGGKDIYSALLRFMVIRRPDAREIFWWLADTDEPEVVLEAARNVLNKNLKISERAIPLRELILAFVYPTMKLEEVLRILESEKVDRETILLACRLVGAYIGNRDR